MRSTWNTAARLAALALAIAALLGGCGGGSEPQDTTPVAGAQARPTAEPGKVVVGSGASARQMPAEGMFTPRK